MHIRTITIRRLRAIEELTIDLTAPSGLPRRRLVLLGPNGCGKTSIVRAIAHLFGTFDERYGVSPLRISDLRRPPSQTRPKEATEHGTVEVELELSPEEQVSVRAIHPDAALRGWVRRDVGYDFLRLFEPNPFDDVARAVIEQASTPPCVLLPARRGALTQTDHIGLDDASRVAPKENCLGDSDRFTSFGVRLALAHAAPDIYDREGRLRRMWKAIERHIPFMPRPQAVDGLRLLLRNREGILISLEELSDGERSILLIMTEIALRHPVRGVVLIDEIEQHLHLRWQTELLDATQALEPTAQFIITTQADYVAASAPADALRIGDWEA